MSGHSKWANIKHRKAAVDKKRGKEFSKIAKAIIAASRVGGGNAADNIGLRVLLDKARAANMPRDTVERAIQKGTGELEGEEIIEQTYEGYGPGGAGIVIKAVTDNGNRTDPEIRGILEKRGGSLGKPGSVAWNFEQKALFTVPGEGVDEDQLIEVALDAGAEDVANEDGTFSVTAPPTEFAMVLQALESAGFKPDTSDVTYVPKSRVMLSAKDARRMLAIIEALEDHDDVQAAITNGDLPDEVMAELE